MRKNIHTNIMLDLECTGILPNPCILQIGAVHFNIDTGEEYSHFCTPVSLKSCEDVKLQSTEDTMEWLLQNSPQVLAESRVSEVTIFQALFRLNIFVRKAVRSNRHRLEESGHLYESDMAEPMIWGNGAVADNTWINSAYAACGMADRKPWTFKNDMCVRTLVRTASDILGRNFAREERFQGTRHDALDDCRHQIRYMVKARNTMVGLSEKPKPPPTHLMTLPIREKKAVDVAGIDINDASKDSKGVGLSDSPNNILTDQHPPHTSEAAKVPVTNETSPQPLVIIHSSEGCNASSFTEKGQKPKSEPDTSISSTSQTTSPSAKKEIVACKLHRSDAPPSSSSWMWMCCQCGSTPFGQSQQDLSVTAGHMAASVKASYDA
ncbi:hypothetical protein IFR05_002672 [Cadophora sp. M221]|nr:hypothetical protein IFR05_002672 [Cadophora sp. M221]